MVFLVLLVLVIFKRSFFLGLEFWGGFFCFLKFFLVVLYFLYVVFFENECCLFYGSVYVGRYLFFFVIWFYVDFLGKVLIYFVYFFVLWLLNFFWWWFLFYYIFLFICESCFVFLMVFMFEEWIICFGNIWWEILYFYFFYWIFLY